MGFAVDLDNQAHVVRIDGDEVCSRQAKNISLGIKITVARSLRDSALPRTNCARAPFE
jgi:hypothetical protein